MRTADVVYEQHDKLEFIVAGYWHLRESVNKAMACTIDGCHHEGIDRDSVRRHYEESLAEICHELVDTIMDAM